MCGRFSYTLSAEFIRRLFGTESDIPNLGPLWNLAPSAAIRTDWRLWLGEEAGDTAGLLRPAPDDTLRPWPASPRVNSPRNNDASLIAPMVIATEGGGPNPA